VYIFTPIYIVLAPPLSSSCASDGEKGEQTFGPVQKLGANFVTLFVDFQGSTELKVPPVLNNNNEGTSWIWWRIEWTMLEHNGVIFPPPYKPHGVKMLYNGQPVDLTPEQEEVIY